MRADRLCTLPAFPVGLQINGAQGKMGIAVAEAALRAGVPLLPLGITGPGMAPVTLTHRVAGREDSVEVKVLPAEDRDRVMDEALAMAPDHIVVDYTLPSAVHGEWTGGLGCGGEGRGCRAG